MKFDLTGVNGAVRLHQGTLGMGLRVARERRSQAPHHHPKEIAEELL